MASSSAHQPIAKTRDQRIGCLTLRITSGALSDHAGAPPGACDVRRRVRVPQPLLRRRPATSHDARPLAIVVKIRPSTAMKSFTRPPHSRPTVPPAARSSDVRTLLVGEKHIGAAIEALCLALQPPCERGQWCQIGIVGNDHEHVNILRIRFRRHDRAQHGDATNTGNLSGGCDESAQCVEQLLSVTLGRVHRSFNPAAEPH